jgi:hypothetical protein
MAQKFSGLFGQGEMQADDIALGQQQIEGLEGDPLLSFEVSGSPLDVIVAHLSSKDLRELCHLPADHAEAQKA